MADTTVGKLQVDIDARLNALDSKLREAEQKTAASGKKMESVKPQIFGASGEQSVKMLSDFARFAGVVRAGSAAVQLLADSIRIAADETANFDEKVIAWGQSAQEAFGKIPIAGDAFAIGGIVGQMLFGDQGDADKINRETAELQKNIDAMLKRSQNAASFKGLFSDLEFSNRQATASPLEATMARLDKEMADAERKLTRFANRSGGLISEEMLNESLAKLREFYDRRKQMAVDADKQEQAEKDAAAQREAERAAQALEAAQRAQAERLADLDSQIRQAELKAQGRDLDAELEQVDHYYNKLIDRAETAAEKERLIKLRGLALDEVKQREAAGNIAPEIDPMAGLNLAAITQGRLEAGAQVGAGAKQVVEDPQVAKSNTLLAEIRDKLGRIGLNYG